ncbi:MAG: UDP-glucose 4-epimerase GalE [Gemmataceae bacterium]|nr:UDP-glucose 4-epimerase GalE [Gemmataceae bacterium]
MRILVVGGAGYIGSHTTRQLAESGHDVWVYDNLSMGHRAAVPADRLIVADLADVGTLDNAFIMNRIDAVVHFAALASVGESVRDPARYWHNNVCLGIQLLETARRNGVKRFVFSSTAATYGEPDAIPITESAPQRPVNPYGHTKLAFEKALGDYAAAYGMGYAALRYFNAAGASRDGTIGEDHSPETHLIPIVLQVALGQRPHLDVFGDDYPTPDGTCIRDYVHVEDLAQAHVLALEKLTDGAGLHFNLGTGGGYSIREVIKAAESVTGRKIAVRNAPRRPGDPAALVASSAKIRQELGWKPRYPDLESILETAWKWHRSHPNGYGDR